MGIWLTALSLACFLLGTSAHAESVTGNLVNITSGYSGQVPFKLTVSGNPGTSTVTFTIQNLAKSGFSVSEVYFYDGALLGATMAPAWSSDATVWSESKISPSELPGIKSLNPPLNLARYFGADALTKNGGIKAGETWKVTFYLKPKYPDASGGDGDSTNDIGDVLADLNCRGMAVGLHVHDVPGNIDSISVIDLATDFINPVPLPGSVTAGLALLSIVILLRVRRRLLPD